MRQISWRPELTAVFRNEIYARHGYIFKNDFWNDFFQYIYLVFRRVSRGCL
ncbi:MAG: hypothetical protein ACLR0U_00880 [Enterocloster clostridioformis]